RRLAKRSSLTFIICPPNWTKLLPECSRIAKASRSLPHAVMICSPRSMLLPRSCYLLLLLLTVLRLTQSAQADECKTLYGIHDHTPDPTPYLNHVTTAAGCGWVTA